jgi:hypothetical protein
VAEFPPVSARDPRYRPYRAFLWALYFGCVLLGVGLVIVSVARQLQGPQRGPPGAVPPTRAALRSCIADLEALFREQHQRAWALGGELEGRAPFEDWNAWSHGWERRVDDLSERCALDVDDRSQAGFEARGEMAAARDAMRALHRAYALHLNRFAAEQGDLVRGAAEALAHARAAVAAVR